MQINFGRNQGQQADRIAKARQEQAAARNEQMKADGFLRYMQNSKCPYGVLAKNGVIQYNGVVFQCDYEHNTISLGDVTSDPKKVLNVALPSGGNLKINVDCFGDIARAAGMFSPEDLNAIMNAIHQYNYCTKKLNEIEEEKAKGVEAADEQTKAVGGEDKSAQGADQVVRGENTDLQVEDKTAPGKDKTLDEIAAYKQELYRKVIRNEADQKFQIGGQELSLKEWDKMLARFDEAQQQIMDAIREETEAREAEQAKGQAADKKKDL